MAADLTVSELYDSFLGTYEAARAAGVIASAYHALAGALHCADALDDEAGVKQVKSLAERLRAALDRTALADRLSAEPAMARGQSSVFVSLAIQAESILVRLRAGRTATAADYFSSRPGSARSLMAGPLITLPNRSNREP
jgi:hypothetical protein